MTDQVTIQRGAPVEDPAHAAAMIAKVDGVEAPQVPAENTPAPAGERPTWLPEKFASVEDMAKAYGELEAKQGAGKAPEVTPPAPEVNPDGTPKVPDGVAEELSGKGLDLAEFSQEFSTSGALAPESYAKLEAAGYPKVIVDQYIAGQTALAVQYEADVKAVAGGSEKFAEVAAWAATALSPQEAAAYNKAIDSGDIDQAKLAVAGITQKFNTANPSEGELVYGNAGAKSTGETYADISQMQADMANPEYKKSAAFRQKVADKIGRSNIL